MADREESTQLDEADVEDEQMAGLDDEDGEGNGDEGEAEPKPADDTEIPSNPQTIFLDYLRSPIVTLVVGSGDEETTLTAHQAILTQSPYFAEQLGSVSTGGPPMVQLPNESLDAVVCFLQYQYTGEYFPKRDTTTQEGLELDPSIPLVDETGAQLLKHARVYTLAEKFGLPQLKTLAHSKIHRVNSTAAGEIAYARYVYGHTPADDVTIRKPVAAFWATRSHVLRHEAEQEFKAMCLEFPQFGFDVLSLILDQREKRVQTRAEDGTPGAKGRKRMRPSVDV